MLPFTTLKALPWHKKCGIILYMKTPKLEKAPWARKEERKKIWAERRVRFFHHVRGIFVLLFVSTVLVYFHNNKVQIETVTFAKLNQLAGKSTTSDRLRTKAINHQNEIDSINQRPASQNPQTP